MRRKYWLVHYSQKKLATGVPFERVLIDIGEATADSEDLNFKLERIHLVDKKDLYNISEVV